MFGTNKESLFTGVTKVREYTYIVNRWIFFNEKNKSVPKGFILRYVYSMTN